MGPQGQRVAAGVRRRRDHQKLREPPRARVSGSPCRKPGFPPSSLVRDRDIGDRLGDDEIHVRTSTRTSHPPAGHSSPPRLTPARPADLAHVRRGPPHPSSPRWRAPPPCSPRSASSQSLFLGPRLCHSSFPAAQRPRLRPSRSWLSRLPSESPVLPRLGASPICLPRVAE